MKEHYYGFVELTSEELTDIQGGENWAKTLADWCLGFYFQGSARGGLPSSAGALSGLCSGSGQEGKYASLHL